MRICVSSRENNVFECGFHPEQKLRFQDLTREDMLLLARDKLGRIERLIDCQI